VSQRRRRSAQDMINAYQANRRSMPILDMADGRYEPDMRAYMNFQGGMR